jgi:hypothetical protein
MRRNRILAVSALLTAMAILMLPGVHNDTSAVEGQAADPGAVTAAAGEVLRTITGRVTMLRVHDLGTGYGPSNDFLDGEVVIHLDHGTMGLGFQLRNDGNLPVNRAMLDLLHDAFRNDWTVVIHYWILPGKNNGEIYRVILTK